MQKFLFLVYWKDLSPNYVTISFLLPIHSICGEIMYISNI